MPDLWMDVDAALSEVPVNIAALIDDTDFKTREEAVTYDQAGMDLVWNFTTTAGATTQTAVTPTTGGDYDWSHQGNGMYTIEIPASGGASINNDTEGFGWFSGFATGILPWRGPTIGFRAAALNNALIDGGDLLDVNVTHVADTAQTANDNGADINAILVDTNSLNDTKISQTLNLTASGNIGIDWANVENPETAVDLSATDIQLVDTCTTNTDMVGTNNAALASVCTEARLAELDAANLPTDIAAVKADTVQIQADIAALENISAAEVNAEVVDALNVDTYAEPGQGNPPATASLVTKIGYTYKSWRNKKDNDGSTTNLYADDGSTVDQKQATSESGGTVTAAEWVTGP